MRSAAFGSLQVASRTSAFALKGQNLDVREIGRRLNVRSVLEGAVRAAGDRLRVSVTLTNVEDGYQSWSVRYDRAMTDVFEVQDEIARTVVSRLHPQSLSGAPVVAPGASDPEAYRAYLLGRHFANRRTESDLRQAIASYESGLAREPGFALAAAGLADAWFMLGVYGAVAPDEAMQRAKRAVEQAEASGRETAEALAVRGSVRAVYDWNWSGAEADFQRALALSPGNPTVLHRYAVNCLLPRGRFTEAGTSLRAALDHDPLSLVTTSSIGLLHYLTQRSPTRPSGRSGRSWISILTSGWPSTSSDWRFSRADGRSEAVAVLEEATTASSRGAETLAALGSAYAVAGRREDATTNPGGAGDDLPIAIRLPCLARTAGPGSWPAGGRARSSGTGPRDACGGNGLAGGSPDLGFPEERPEIPGLAGTRGTGMTPTEVLFHRLSADQGDLESSLNGGRPVGPVERVEMGLSDPHDGGRTVALVTFERGLRVIYKPRPVELECAFDAMVDWWNRRGGGIELRAARALPRRDYGWAEFIDAAPCLDETAAGAVLRARGGTDLSCLAFRRDGSASWQPDRSRRASGDRGSGDASASPLARRAAVVARHRTGSAMDPGPRRRTLRRERVRRHHDPMVCWSEVPRQRNVVQSPDGEAFTPARFKARIAVGIPAGRSSRDLQSRGASQPFRADEPVLRPACPGDPAT